jgi:hypothetical protein
MTVRRLRRPLFAGLSAALGVLVGGGFLGLYGGSLLALQNFDSSGSENALLQLLELLVEAAPYVWLGALLGAVLGWLVLPSLLGSVMKWPKVWFAFGVQVVVGIALWLTGAFIASVLDVGAVGSWVFVLLVIMGPPAAGRWFVGRSHSQTVPTDDIPQTSPGPRQ